MMMDDRFSALRELATRPGTRKQRAQLAVPLVRSLGPYRWTGLYDVTAEEIIVIAWDGPEPPTYPRFPVSKGLNGAAVAARRAVIVQDVTADPRYLTTIGGTRGEMIQPIVGAAGMVVGTIDVEARPGQCIHGARRGTDVCVRRGPVLVMAIGKRST